MRQTLHGGVKVARVPHVHQPAGARQRRPSRGVAPSIQSTASVVGNPVRGTASSRPVGSGLHALRAGVPVAAGGRIAGEASDGRWVGTASRPGPVLGVHRGVVVAIDGGGPSPSWVWRPFLLARRFGMQNKIK